MCKSEKVRDCRHDAAWFIFSLFIEAVALAQGSDEPFVQSTGRVLVQYKDHSPALGYSLSVAER